MDPYQLTTYSVGDFVLREYPPTKAGNGPPNKYSSWWRGPFEVTNVQRTGVKNIYTIRNLVTQHEYIADATQLNLVYHDPIYVVSLNIAVNNTDEYVVDQIVGHLPIPDGVLDGQEMRRLMKHRNLLPTSKMF